MTTVRLRRFEPSDIPVAAEIEARVYPQPWSERVFQDELGEENRTYLLAEMEGVIAGYGGLMVVGNEAHITTLVVDHAHRQGRIGTRLMLELTETAISQGARSLTLEVRASNVAAQALYRRFGMAPVGVRKNYYRTEDALIMWVHDIDGAEYADLVAGIRARLEEEG